MNCIKFKSNILLRKSIFMIVLSTLFLALVLFTNTVSIVTTVMCSFLLVQITNTTARAIRSFLCHFIFNTTILMLYHVFVLFKPYGLKGLDKTNALNRFQILHYLCSCPCPWNTIGQMYLCYFCKRKQLNEVLASVSPLYWNCPFKCMLVSKDWPVSEK